jgi:mRNA-degrading endonuclease RelE of RelBE toxin-antitoxin system
MKRSYRPPFRKFVKKQTRPFQLIIEDEVHKIIETPEIGDLKKGDLQGYRVHKFRFRNTDFLIAYRLHEAEVVFYIIGPHENFYQNLKKYIRGLRLQ